MPLPSAIPVPIGMNLGTVIATYSNRHSVVWVPIEEYEKELFKYRAKVLE